MRHARVGVLGAALLVIGAGIVWAPSCAQREPKVGFPPLNKTMTLMPLTVGQSGPAKLAAAQRPSGLRFTIMWGGSLMKDESLELRFYKSLPATTPALSLSWGQLKDLYKSTGCANDQIATLDGPGQGMALVCDGRIPIDEFVYIEGVNSKGEKRAATSWSTWLLQEDVAAASIQLL